MGILDKWTSGSAYDLWMGRWSRLLAEQFLLWLDVRPGLRWLDVCCGGGIVTEAVGQRCSPASVKSIDASPQQIAFARRHRQRQGVAFQLGDAMHLPFPDASFDVAVCGLGLNFIPEPDRALREMRRVTVPGGVVAAYVCDYAEGARFLREFWNAAVEIDPAARGLDQASPFPLCTAVAMPALFEKTGFRHVRYHALEIVTRFENFADYWTPLLNGQGSAPSYVSTLADSIRNAIRDRLRASLATDSRGVIELPAKARAVRGLN